MRRSASGPGAIAEITSDSFHAKVRGATELPSGLRGSGCPLVTTCARRAPPPDSSAQCAVLGGIVGPATLPSVSRPRARQAHRAHTASCPRQIKRPIGRNMPITLRKARIPSRRAIRRAEKPSSPGAGQARRARGAMPTSRYSRGELRDACRSGATAIQALPDTSHTVEVVNLAPRPPPRRHDTSGES